MESEEKKIAKVLKEIGFSHLLQYFIDEEFTLESFRLLTLDIVKEFLPKAGPRVLFWSRYTRYFQNEQRKTKGIPPVPPAATVYESDSDKDSDDPLSDPLSDANIEFTFELPTSTQIVKEEPRVLDEELFENLLESATLIPTPQTTPSTSLNLRKTTPSTSTKNSSTVCTVAQYAGSKSVKEHLNTAQGALLRNKYKKHQTFDDRDRGLLARMIVYKEYESLGITPAQKFKLTNERLKFLAEEIAQVFPNENPDTYYFPYNSATR
uniref:Uncharacterized protein n=1 Tax=Lutzomyia longipalpis TaxID=7200 RepID=A0A1B0FV42_LUTLO